MLLLAPAFMLTVWAVVVAGPGARAAGAQQTACATEVSSTFRRFFPPPDGRPPQVSVPAAPASILTFLEQSGIMAEATRESFVRSFNGEITARIAEPGEQFLRYAPTPVGIGSFLTKSRFDSPGEAWHALALRHSPGNNAQFRQTVTVQQCAIVLEGGITDGRAGVSQTLVTARETLEFGVGVSYDRRGSMVATAYLSAAAVLGVLYVLYRMLSGNWNPFKLIEGADGRPSTSKFQFFLWTVVVVFGYTAIYAARASKHEYGAIDDIPKNVLLAMGFSAATAVAAKGITVSYIDNKKVQKTSVGDAQPSSAPATAGVVPVSVPAIAGASPAPVLAGVTPVPQPKATGPGAIFQDDEGVPDLSKVQMVAWTLIAAGMYLISMGGQINRIVDGVDLPAMPDIDATLMVLMGLGQGAYLGKKLTTTDVPRPTGLSVTSGKPPLDIVVQGAGFGDQQGAVGGQITLNSQRFGGNVKSWSDTQIVFTFPERDPNGIPWPAGQQVMIGLEVSGQVSPRALPFMVTA
jgi:hypothetical protein